MPSFVPPKRATEFIFYASLVSQADTKLFQNNPTLAAGDFLVSTDGSATTNLDTLPVVTPASSDLIKITVSVAEMTGDNVAIIASDAAGAQWCDQSWNIQTAVRQIDDLAEASVCTEARLSELDEATSGKAANQIDLIKTEADKISLADAGAGVTGSVIEEVENRATPAQVATELNTENATDTVTLPGQAAPPLAPTRDEMISWLYKVLRNRTDQTSTLWKLYADNETTVDAKATVSDDGTTAIVQEIETGP